MPHPQPEKVDLTDKNSKADVIWSGVRVIVGANEEVVLKRKCELDILGYDIFRLFAAISTSMEIKIFCVIDGKRKEIISRMGKGSYKFL